MPYDDATDSGAMGGDSMPNQSEDQGDGSGRDDTFFIPPDMIPNAETLKPGEELIFKFLGRDKDGHLEVEYAKGDDGGEEGQSWQDEMRQSVDQPMPAQQEQKGY